MHRLDDESTCGLEIPIGPILVSLVDRFCLFPEAHTKSVAPQHPHPGEAAGILQPDWEGR
jgi:hypothetical protein